MAESQAGVRNISAKDCSILRAIPPGLVLERDKHVSPEGVSRNSRCQHQSPGREVWPRDTVCLVLNSAPVEHGAQENPELEFKVGKKGKRRIKIFKRHIYCHMKRLHSFRSGFGDTGCLVAI